MHYVQYKTIIDYMSHDITSVLGRDDLAVAATLTSVANAHNGHGKYDLALEKYEEALRIQVSVLGHDHPQVASNCQFIALVKAKCA